MLPADTTSWVVTDGKIGDEGQCLAVAEALGLTPSVRRIAPRAPFSWAMPYGPIDPREAPSRSGSPVAPPFPDILIASGRRAIAYVRHVKRASRGRTFTVILKDPRTGTGAADLIWVPAHDRLRGPNVIATLTSPHRITAERLIAARTAPPPFLAELPKPRAAVVVGGDSRHHSFTAEDIARFAGLLGDLAASDVSLMVTLSRRTSPALANAVSEVVARARGYIWDGQGENPYIALLALADSVVVTADSANMVAEAAVTGVPILVYEPSGGHRKIKALLEGLTSAGAVRPFTGRLEVGAYLPLNSTVTIADAIAAAFKRYRSNL
ncbi:MAG: mitochondrial fission ELM1 family protein [Chelatococcus sp.]|nr:mitochondrial fission ELM1 family protein [Chelatococcus sp.]MBS7737703.1 mitochondrial fission ELM1 family protein [Chelatococcus sp. HY11]MBX3536386.1 mitochondrial fission ELM1 family protein [Chelatococcus sp.]MBX3544163.1 mitochondrial fission ELM1 family protein [Chelatococcus sp.]MCO5079515.1 mitochondrial fission ELM1 family protein [Chelatococcus sp.]